MKKLGGLLITISYIFIMVNCNLEAPIDEPVNIIIEIKETRIMNDFIVKPITEHPAYFVQGNAVSGIPANCKAPTDLMRFLPEIEIEGKVSTYHFDEFFVKDGKPYFKLSMIFPVGMEGTEQETITKYCTQSNGKITYLTEAKFPAIPEPERIEGQSGDYSILNGDYNGDPISIVSRDYDEPMGFIDGFIEIEGGLLIHAQVGRGASRPEGLLFWPDGLRTMNHWKEPGRFWK